MITHGDLDKMAERKVGLKFTMIFLDGDRLTGCLHRNIKDSDKKIIEQCNKTNPGRWGEVIGITDKRKVYYWSNR